MISLAPGTKVYLASKPVSMRLGFDGLAALVRPLFAVEPYGGHVFLFRSKSGNYLKALHWDGCRVASHKFVTACLSRNVPCRLIIAPLMGFGLRGAFGVVRPEAHKLRFAFALLTLVSSDVHKAVRGRALPLQ